MNQTIHARPLPVGAFRRIVGQMQHDLFHVYTVDQHILMVLRNVRRFTIDRARARIPVLLAARWRTTRSTGVLYVAALFHDIAKGRGGDHSKLGVRRRAAIRPANTSCMSRGRHRTGRPSWCEHHLTMSARGAETGYVRPGRDRRPSPKPSATSRTPDRASTC